jgi:hypothetical protein
MMQHKLYLLVWWRVIIGRFSRYDLRWRFVSTICGNHPVPSLNSHNVPVPPAVAGGSTSPIETVRENQRARTEQTRRIGADKTQIIFLIRFKSAQSVKSAFKLP